MISNKIENFNNQPVIDGCHYACSNLTTINMLLIIIIMSLCYMYFN